MGAEYITVTPVKEGGKEGTPRRIMCHAIVAFYLSEDHEPVIVLADGVPITIHEEPEFIEAQLNEYQRVY